MSSTTTVKIVCNGCIRRFVLPEHSFEAFRHLVCQHAELSPLSTITFTFLHPSCGTITVTDTPSLQRCLQVASAHNIIARLNVSTGASDCDMKNSSSPAEASCPASPALALAPAPTPTPTRAASVPRPQLIVAKPVVSVPSGEQAGAPLGGTVLPFDLNSLINGMAAQTGALVSSLQPEAEQLSQLSNFVNGILSQAESAANNIFTSSQENNQHSPQAQPQPQAAQPQQQQQPKQPQQTPVLPDLGNLLSSIMAQPGIANILSVVQPQQPQPPQAQSQQQPQQPQQQATPGVAQLLGSILPQGSSPFGLQQVFSLLQPSQPGNQQQVNNQGSQLASVVQLAQVLGPVLPQMLSVVGTMMQQQQPRPVAPVNPPATTSSPLGGLGAMAQSLAQQAFGTAPVQPNVSSASSDGSEYSQQLSVLSGMGFNDRYLNTQLLREANGNVRVVFDQLRRREQFAASLGN